MCGRGRAGVRQERTAQYGGRMFVFATTQGVQGDMPSAIARGLRENPKSTLAPWLLHAGPLSLELQLKAAAGGRPEGPLGGGAEVVVTEPATGRCKREGARTSRHPPVGQRRAWPRSTRRAGT